MNSFNPFRDIALWAGSWAPSDDLVTTYQLMGFMLSFVLVGIVSVLIGAIVERLYMRIAKRRRMLRKWHNYD